MYNMVNGFNPACVFVLPLLGKPSDYYPRFRDCFITEDGNIAVYTRVGGGNRDYGYGEEKLYEDENFVKTYDDDFDTTYATYEFRCPEEWKDDFEKIRGGRLTEVSDKYVEYIEKFYPKLAEEGVIKKFCREESTEGTDNE